MNDYPPIDEPHLNDERLILIRTITEDDGSYDARFARYEIHPLPLGIDEDSATQSAFQLAEEARSWSVWVGRVVVIDGVDGIEKVTTEARAFELARANATSKESV